MSGEQWHQTRFRARTSIDNYRHFLGWYDTREEARAAVVRFRQRRGLPVDPVAAQVHRRKLNRSLGRLG